MHPVDFGTSLQYLDLNPPDPVHFEKKDLDPDPQRRIDYSLLTSQPVQYSLHCRLHHQLFFTVILSTLEELRDQCDSTAVVFESFQNYH